MHGPYMYTCTVCVYIQIVLSTIGMAACRYIDVDSMCYIRINPLWIQVKVYVVYTCRLYTVASDHSSTWPHRSNPGLHLSCWLVTLRRHSRRGLLEDVQVHVDSILSRLHFLRLLKRRTGQAP